MAVAMDSSELEYKCVGRRGTSVSAWLNRFTGGSFFSVASFGFGCGFEAISVRMRFSVVVRLGGRVVMEVGSWVWDHLRMADLRARLGITVEKSGVVPSGS